jgi:hypothetical protein
MEALEKSEETVSNVRVSFTTYIFSHFISKLELVIFTYDRILIEFRRFPITNMLFVEILMLNSSIEFTNPSSVVLLVKFVSFFAIIVFLVFICS